MSATAVDPSPVFRALGDPHRLAVVDRLTERAATVSELAEQEGLSLPGMMKHLRVLEECGVLTRHKNGRVVTCSLEAAPLLATERWLHDRTAYWSATLDRLAELVDGPKTSPGPEQRTKLTKAGPTKARSTKARSTKATPMKGNR